MAEFQEVLRQWRRMCTKNNCDQCPGKGKYQYDSICQHVKSKIQLEPDAVENIIMSWAAEHPEPVYPTWGEWLENMGIVSKAKSEYSEIFDTICVGTRMFDPIPADIAQKLGIEQK